MQRVWSNPHQWLIGSITQSSMENTVCNVRNDILCMITLLIMFLLPSVVLVYTHGTLRLPFWLPDCSF